MSIADQDMPVQHQVEHSREGLSLMNGALPFGWCNGNAGCTRAISNLPWTSHMRLLQQIIILHWGLLRVVCLWN